MLHPLHRAHHRGGHVAFGPSIISTTFFVDHRDSYCDDVALARQFEVPADELKRAIKDKDSVDAFKVRVLEGLAAKSPAYSAGQITITSEPDPGTRAAMLTHWGTTAQRALAARGVNVKLPDYSKEVEIQRNYIDGDGNKFHRSMSGAVTLLDVAKIDAGIGAPIISEVAVLAPEASVIDAEWPIRVEVGPERI